MKKLLFLLSLFLVLVFPTKSLAQSPLFDFSKPVQSQTIPQTIPPNQVFIYPNSKDQTVISLLPFTTLTIPNQSFDSVVTVFVYQERWDAVKSALPKGQSPISGYYFKFLNPNGKLVFPTKPLAIASYNNYISSNSYLYFPDESGNIGQAQVSQAPNQVKFELKNQTSFVLAVNKELSSFDNSLHPLEHAVKSSPNPSTLPNNSKNNLPIYAISLILLIAVVGGFLYYLNRSKKNGRV